MVEAYVGHLTCESSLRHHMSNCVKFAYQIVILEGGLLSPVKYVTYG